MQKISGPVFSVVLTETTLMTQKNTKTTQQFLVHSRHVNPIMKISFMLAFGPGMFSYRITVAEFDFIKYRAPP